MVETQEPMTKDGTHSLEGADAGTAAAEGATTDARKKTAGAVGAFVGMLTGGLAIAATAGFVVGIAAGVAVTRLATPPPPPRWQVWR